MGGMVDSGSEPEFTGDDHTLIRRGISRERKPSGRSFLPREVIEREWKEHRFASIFRLQRLPLKMTEGEGPKNEIGKRSGFFASLWNDY